MLEGFLIKKSKGKTTTYAVNPVKKETDIDAKPSTTNQTKETTPTPKPVSVSMDPDMTYVENTVAAGGSTDGNALTNTDTNRIQDGTVNDAQNGKVSKIKPIISIQLYNPLLCIYHQTKPSNETTATSASVVPNIIPQVT